MNATTTAGAWGLTGAQFLGGYLALCAVAAYFIWQQYRRALGPGAGANDPLPELGVYTLALLGGGPDRATTVAATQLYRDGRLKSSDGALAATGQLDATADPLERDVFETIRRERRLPAAEMRNRVRESAAMQALTAQMTSNGLLLDGSQARRMRLLWIVPALLTALGVARLLTTGGADGAVIALVALTAIATVWLARLRPLATNRGQRLLQRRRRESAVMLRHPVMSETIMAAALFGGGALWLADPTIASALGVPRESESTANGGGGSSFLGGGGCGAGGGAGCGGGGGGGCGGGGG